MVVATTGVVTATVLGRRPPHAPQVAAAVLALKNVQLAHTQPCCCGTGLAVAHAPHTRAVEAFTYVHCEQDHPALVAVTVVVARGVMGVEKVIEGLVCETMTGAGVVVVVVATMMGFEAPQAVHAEAEDAFWRVQREQVQLAATNEEEEATTTG